MSSAESILAFINITLYLIIHNLKFRRFAEEKMIKVINSMFGGIIFLVMIILLQQIVRGAKAIIYIDIILITTIITIITIFIIKNVKQVINLFFSIYKSKKNILESVFLTTLIILGFISSPIWFVSLTVLIIFLVKEAFLMSDSMKKLFKSK